MAASKLSDEELLGDNLGGSIYMKSPENDLIGDDGEIDEDALLSVDDTVGKSVSVSYSNDNIHPMTSRRLSRAHGQGHQHDVHQILLVDEQAFVFDKTDTTDLEDELNIAGEEEAQFGISLEHNEGLIYNDGTEENFSDNLYHNENDSNVQQNFSSNRIIESAEERYANVGQESFEDSTVLYDSISNVNFSGDGHEDSMVDSSSVELGYEQPTEHEEQVHLEYEHSDSHNSLLAGTGPTGTNEQYASESESDDENSRHSRGKFTSERTGVISLTATTTRESIPDTLEINDEQAAQIEQFLSDKSGRGHKAKNRMSVHSRLGVRPNAGPQALLPSPRLNLFPRGVFIQRPRMGGPFQNSLSVTFPGMINQRGPFLNRMINERIPFSLRPQCPPVGPFPLSLPMSPQQRFSFQNVHQGRFPGVTIQRGQFMRPEQKMHQSNMSGRITKNMGGITSPPYRLRGSQEIKTSGLQPLIKSQEKKVLNPQKGQPIPSLVQPVSMPFTTRSPSHQRLESFQNVHGLKQPSNHQPVSLQGPQSISQIGHVRYHKIVQGDSHFVKKHKIYINPRFQTPLIRQQVPQSTKIVPLQVYKARAILEKAKQTHIKQAQLTSTLKRKTTENTEAVPIKVLKSDSVKTESDQKIDMTHQEESMDEESRKMKALLEEQKKKRELIKKQKEIARQKQAVLKRKELEEKMKVKGKLTQNNSEKDEVVATVNSSQVKALGSGVASRLGPPRNQEPKPLIPTSTESVIQKPQVFQSVRPSILQGTFQLQHPQNVQRKNFALRRIIPHRLRPSTSSEHTGIFSAGNSSNKLTSSSNFRPANSSDPHRNVSYHQLRLTVPSSAPGALTASPRLRGHNAMVDSRYRFQRIPTNIPPPQPFLTPASSSQDLRFHLPQQSGHLQPSSDSYNFPPSQTNHYQPQYISHGANYLPESFQPPPQQQHVAPTHAQSLSHVAQSSVLYNTAPNQQYQNSASYQSQSLYNYYSHSTSSQASALLNEHLPYGQSIQTIGQHIQPTTVGQMRSILHNVKPSSQVQISEPSGHNEHMMALNQQVPVNNGPQKIAILNVPQQATRETIIKICRHFGHVMGVNLIRSQNKAIVQFQTGEQAAKCVSKCDQKCLHKTRLTVQLLPYSS